MNEVKKCLRWLVPVYLLLLAINIVSIVGILPKRFPTENIPSLCMFFLSVCLIISYHRRVAGRAALRRTMLAPSYMVMLMALLRCIKYGVFGNVVALGRYTWYLYYIPMLCIPVLLFFVSLYLYSEEERRITQKWGWIVIVTAVLILLVLTNDFHGQVFRFQPGFDNWDSNYSYGFGFYIISVWQYLFYATAVGILIAKCSISKIKYRALLILVPFVLGVTTIVLLITGWIPKIHGLNVIEFPETLCYMAAGILECCIQIGLAPTNKNYKKIMQLTSVPVQITDYDGNCVYRSHTAKALTAEQVASADRTRIGEHTILRRISVNGGFGFWQVDVSELDRLNEELADAKERLSEETELIRLQNELKEKQKAIEQRTAVYDAIAMHTQHQSRTISQIAQRAMRLTDVAEIDRCRKQITLLGAYIKRYANLMLLSSESHQISAGELALSVTEVLRYLNLYGIPGELLNTASGNIPAAKAIAVFESFENLLETHLANLHGVYANLSERENGYVFKLALENMTADRFESVIGKLAAVGVNMQFEYEDDIGYFSFEFSEGGEGV